jgi:hypothetical protein
LNATQEKLSNLKKEKDSKKMFFLQNFYARNPIENLKDLVGKKHHSKGRRSKKHGGFISFKIPTISSISKGPKNIPYI